MAEHRQACDAVQNFGCPGTHPRAFTCGKNNRQTLSGIIGIGVLQNA
jgi:hypothetical protein